MSTLRGIDRPAGRHPLRARVRPRERGGGRGSARALGNAATYAVANGLPRLLTFIFLPIYTRALSPSDYGRLSLVLIIAVAASFVLASGLDVAILRIHYQLEQPSDQRRFVDSLWLVVLATSAIGTAVALAAVSPFVGSAGVLRFRDLALGLGGAVLLVAGTTIPQSILRAQQRRRPYVLLCAGNAVLSTGLTLVLVVAVGLGVTGWLLAIVLANACMLGVAVRLVGWRLPLPFDGSSVRRAFGLGIPLIPHALAQWSLLLADRGVLASIVDTSQLGIYSLAATMTTPALVLVQSISQGFAPSYATAGGPTREHAAMRDTVRLHCILVLWVSLAAVLLCPCAIGLLAAPAFARAAPLVPWLALGYLFLGLYYVPMNALSLVAGRTRLVWVFSIAAAALNLGLVWLCVPRYGLISAAVASAVGYLALLLSVFAYASAVRAPVSYDWQRLAAAVACAAAIVAVALMTTGYTTVEDAAARAGWMVAGMALVGAAGGLRSRHSPSPTLARRWLGSGADGPHRR